MECYVFIDDSNLWIAGQKAQGKKLKDTDIDTRYRIDLGKFLKLVVTDDRHISEAFLYGSVPPPNDTVWKAAREKNFKVKTFQRSGNGREKEVDVAMTSDILDNLYKLIYTGTKENVIFVTVTGDRDLKIPIVKTLDAGIPVELWSWEEAMAREFRVLAHTDKLFTANILDKVKSSFGYTAIMSTREKKDIDPAHAIVYKDVPKGKRFLCELASYINRLMRLFYITSIKSKEEGKRDLIVEFPKSNPEIIFGQLKRMSSFEYQPISYPEYRHPFQQCSFALETKNRFEIFSKKEIDSDSLLDVVESSMNLEMEDFSKSPGEKGATGTGGCDSEIHDFDDWATEVRRKAGEMTYKKKRSQMPCNWGDHCAEASDCPYQHTDEEKKLFYLFPNIKFKFLKIKLCNKLEKHTTTEQQKKCAFAHSEEDSWCMACKMYGHLTTNCKI